MKHVAYVAAILATCQPCWAELSRRGGEFEVTSAAAPVIFATDAAFLSDGQLVVVWAAGSIGDPGDIFIRRFAPSGAPIADEQRINSTIAGEQSHPRIAVAADDATLVVWQSTAAPYAAAQVVDANGVLQGPELNLANDAHPYGTQPAATHAEPGQFVVAWTDETDGYGVRLRSDCCADSSRFASDDTAGRDQSRPAVAASGDVFQVVWYDLPHANVAPTVRGRAFSADLPLGPAFTIAEMSSDAATGPAICGTDGGFVVSWGAHRDPGDALSDVPVFYRRYDRAGAATSLALLATPDLTLAMQGDPSIACRANGDFVLAWNDRDGIAGGDYRGDQVSPFRVRRMGLAGAGKSVAANASEIALLWYDCGTEGGCRVFGQRFVAAPAADCPGDCDGDGGVDIGELTRIVDAAATGSPFAMRECLPADRNLDYLVSIDEAVLAVASALEGCR